MNSKTILVGLLAVSVILSWSCYKYKTQFIDREVPVVSEYQSRRLTVGMIDNFSISGSMLKRLCFYLENTLLLQFMWHRGSSRVADEWELDLRREIRQCEIQFRHKAPGKAVGVYEEFRIVNFLPRWVYIIRVDFEGSSPYWLTFAPNFCGEYVVDKSWWGWGNIVRYRGASFSSLLPDVDNYLLVEIRRQDNVIQHRQIVAGVR